MSNPLATWKWAALKTFQGMIRNPGRMLLSLLICTLALSLLIFSTTLGYDLYKPVRAIPTAQELSVFTTHRTTPERLQELRQWLRSQKGITSIRSVSPEEALQLIGQADLGQELPEGENPLPHILLAKIDTSLTDSEVKRIVGNIRSQKNVDSVAYDESWNSKLATIQSALRTSLWLAVTASCLLILLILLVSAALAAVTEKKYFSDLRLLGASRWFICRPDAWRGTLLFAMGASASLGIAALAIEKITPALSAALSLYRLPVDFDLLPVSWQGWFVAASALAGGILSGMTCLTRNRG